MHLGPPNHQPTQLYSKSGVSWGCLGDLWRVSEAGWRVSDSFNVVRFTSPNPQQQSMCGVPPSQCIFFLHPNYSPIKKAMQFCAFATLGSVLNSEQKLNLYLRVWHSHLSLMAYRKMPNQKMRQNFTRSPLVISDVVYLTSILVFSFDNNTIKLNNLENPGYNWYIYLLISSPENKMYKFVKFVRGIPGSRCKKCEKNKQDRSSRFVLRVLIPRATLCHFHVSSIRIVQLWDHHQQQQHQGMMIKTSYSEVGTMYELKGQCSNMQA